MSPFCLPLFKNKALWTQAMTHSSLVHEQPDTCGHNERLEFLGDAILTYISGAYLYARYPDRPEGELTPIRSALVDQPQLCAFAQQLKLNEHLRLGKGAEKGGGRISARLLSSAFEALIGAYYLEVGENMQLVREYVQPMFDTVVEAAIASGINPKSKLQEWAQKEFGETPQYRVVDSSGPDHAKTFVVEVWLDGAPWGTGRGHSKKIAEKAAASAVLQTLPAKSAS